MGEVCLDDIQLALVPVSKKSVSVYKSVVILYKSILLWSSVFVTLVAKKYRFMQFELDMVFDTR